MTNVRPHAARRRLPSPFGIAAALTLAVVSALGCAGESRPEGAGLPDAGAATDTSSTAVVDAAPAPPSTWAYACPDGRSFVAHYYREGEVLLELPERELRLPRVEAASGARYQSADTLFWDRRGQAILDIRDEWYRGCEGERAESPEDAARLLGYDFRGLGQEPGWLVDVDTDRQVRWVGQYGTVRFATGAPEVVEQTEERTVWRARADGHEITVEALAEACEDAMSGQPFTHTVTVVVDGEELHGCGRPLA